MKYLSLSLLMFVTTLAWAQAPTTQEAKNFSRYIPAQHRLIDITRGDLNRDQKEDVVLVSVGNNTNPRRLTILFGEQDGYRQMAVDNDLIPSEQSLDMPCLADPFVEGGGLSIARNTLKLSLHYLFSCGSYGVTTSTYTFRHENGRFRLIGFDEASFMRNSGEEKDISINFLTGKIKTITGGNMFEPEENHPEIRWGNLNGQRDFYLNAMPEDRDWSRILGFDDN